MQPNSTLLLVKYSSFDNSIVFTSKINSYMIADFAAAIALSQRQRPGHVLTLNFSAVTSPYANGMLAIIATIHRLKMSGLKVRLMLPNDANVRKIFAQTNWSNLLDPALQKSDPSTHKKHLKTRHFSDYKEVADLTNDFMDVVLGNMLIPKDVVKALEWAVYEICDNVINHSKSPVGGFIEVVTFSKKDFISFSVADAGIGILSSLQEALPMLSEHSQAIGEAINPGITRNKDLGQGNGLAGSLRITTMTGGSIDIVSGAGRFYATMSNNEKKERLPNQTYIGTSVSGQIKMNKAFSIQQALTFGAISYDPESRIDLHYEMKDADCLQLSMRHETSGFGTRNSGRTIRTKVKNLLASKPDYTLNIDWADIHIISSSFADELIGKLFVEMGPLLFGATVRNKNMEPMIRQLLDKAISQRMMQQKAN